MNPVPTLTSEQRKENLGKAMAARSERHQMLLNVKRGGLSVPDFIGMAGTSKVVANTRVFALLKAAPGYGFAKAQRALKQIGISETRRVKGLGARQTREICDLFGGAE